MSWVSCARFGITTRNWMSPASVFDVVSVVMSGAGRILARRVLVAGAVGGDGFGSGRRGERTRGDGRKCDDRDHGRKQESGACERPHDGRQGRCGSRTAQISRQT